MLCYLLFVLYILINDEDIIKAWEDTMPQITWRMRAQHNVFAAIDLAHSFGGSKNLYLKKLNQSLRRKIKAQRGTLNAGIYQRLENLVNLSDYRNRNRKPDNRMVRRPETRHVMQGQVLRFG